MHSLQYHFLRDDTWLCSTNHEQVAKLSEIAMKLLLLLLLLLLVWRYHS